MASLNAAVTQTLSYRYLEPGDRVARLKMAITPEKDILIFGGPSDSSWRLTRVQGWSGMNPVRQTLVLLGLESMLPRRHSKRAMI